MTVNYYDILLATARVSVQHLYDSTLEEYPLISVNPHPCFDGEILVVTSVHNLSDRVSTARYVGTVTVSPDLTAYEYSFLADRKLLREVTGVVRLWIGEGVPWTSVASNELISEVIRVTGVPVHEQQYLEDSHFTVFLHGDSQRRILSPHSLFHMEDALKLWERFGDSDMPGVPSLSFHGICPAIMSYCKTSGMYSSDGEVDADLMRRSISMYAKKYPVAVRSMIRNTCIDMHTPGNGEYLEEFSQQYSEELKGLWAE